MFARPLEARERRTITIGTIVSVVALVVAYVVLPTVRRWRDREDAIEGLRLNAGRLIALGTHRDALAASVRAREDSAALLPVRLIRERTRALAAAELQALLQQHAAASRVSVTRLDAAAGADSAGAGATTLPATISAVGDIYGLVDFLRRIEHGPRLLEVTELAVGSSSALRGELLQLSLVVRAPFVAVP